MQYLNVIDASLSNYLLSSGCKLLNKQVDINGLTVWTFSSNGFNFDMENENFKGKCCFADAPKVTFRG